jgi:ATP-dependent DNA ligase
MRGRRDLPYQAGRSKHWLKIKNRQHPAMDRVMERSTSLRSWSSQVNP